MVESGLQIANYSLIVADMHIVIEAYKFVLLLINCLYSLPRAHHQRKHPGVAVRIVGLEITRANLPSTEQLRRIVIECAELVHRSFRQFLSGSIPHLPEC